MGAAVFLKIRALCAIKIFTLIGRKAPLLVLILMKVYLGLLTCIIHSSSYCEA